MHMTLCNREELVIYVGILNRGQFFAKSVT
jgi:hypothetical protein